MKTIKMEMIVVFGAIVLMVCLILGTSVSIVAGTAMTHMTEEQLQKSAGNAAKIVSGILEKETTVLTQIAGRTRISDMDNPMPDRIAAMDEDLKRNGYVRLFFIAPDGKATYSDGSEKDLSAREYFKLALTGKPNVSDTITSTTDGSTVVAVAVPVYDDGNIVGVLGATRDAEYLSKAIADVNIGGSSYAFVLSSKGVLQAHKNWDLVSQQYNIFEEAKKDPRMDRLSALFTDVLAGNSGFGYYWFKDEEKLMGYTPVPGTSWGAAITIPMIEALSNVNRTILTMIIISGFMILFGVIAAAVMGIRMSKPIAEASKVATILADGNLRVEVNPKDMKRKNEIGQLANAMHIMTGSFRSLVGSISTLAEHVAASSEELTATAEQASHTSSEIARTISDIASGATDQAQNTESGVRKANEMGEIIDENVKRLGDLSNSSETMRDAVSSGMRVVEHLGDTAASTAKGADQINEVTQKTNASVTRIEEASEIISAIAVQTNMLALNASIEAARAGDQGKGFAVVAEEIRKLAEQSASATRSIDDMVRELTSHSDISVKTTAEMIHSVTRQLDSVKQTGETYRSVETAASQSLNAIGSAVQQTKQLKERKDQIMDVMQGLLAIAEENAASTEEVAASVQIQSESISEMTDASRQLAIMAQDLINQLGRFSL